MHVMSKIGFYEKKLELFALWNFVNFKLFNGAAQVSFDLCL